MREIRTDPTMRIYAGMAAIWTWFAIVMQFYLFILNREVPIGETIIRFLSFFTILANIFVAISLTVVTVDLNTSICRFCRRADTITAINVYIIVVAVIYNIILRPLWNPDGLQKLVNEMLHSVIPALYFLFWILFVPKKGFTWLHSLPWLIFPLVYTVFIVLRGNYTGYYPYPFINVAAIGYPQAVANGVWILLFFKGVSLLLILMAKIFVKKKHTNSSPLYSKE